MRAAPAASLVTVVVVALAVPASLGASQPPGLTRAFTGARLPAPITVTSPRADVRIARGGRITHIPAPRPGFPARATWFPGTGTWYEIQRGHLIVGHAGAPPWRSRGLFPSRQRLGVVAAGPPGVAFSYHGWLYVAPRGGAERRVARGEGAVGWTAGGVYTYGGRGQLVRLRRATGTQVTTVARRPHEHVFDAASASLYLISRGQLISAHGASVTHLASLAAIGLPPRESALEPLGGLIALIGPDRLVVLRPDGSAFASTPLPRSGGQPETISSGLAVAPRRAAVAFTAAAAPPADPRNPRRSLGIETVYLLRPGSRTAAPIHAEDVAFAVCERGAGVEWHGRWILYSATEGNLAAIDSRGSHRAIELSGVIRRLVPSRVGVGAYWGRQGPAL